MTSPPGVAINSNDVAVLDATFRNDARTIRYVLGENLYGYQEIAAFRALRARQPWPYRAHFPRP
jgi:Protein of unknown function (DUF3225)